MSWPTSCVRHNELLANHTSFRIGGPAEWFAEPETLDELLAVLREATQAGVPVCVLGGGTNALVADRGLAGLVISLGKTFRTTELLPSTSPDQARVRPSTIAQPFDIAQGGERVEPDATLSRVERVRCGAAVSTQRLVALGCQHGWGEVDILAGLPGQIGGAIIMNAQNIGQFLETVTLVGYDGAVKHLSREAMQFTYRYTALEPGIVVEAIFRFSVLPVEESLARIQQMLTRRNTTQDVRLPSAGCAFKNPPGHSAGRLIDEAGLKGARIGDAQVSARHANFIVNLGQATCEDVLSLMEHIQRRVFDHHGVWLEPEVRLFGEPRQRTQTADLGLQSTDV